MSADPCRPRATCLLVARMFIEKDLEGKAKPQSGSLWNPKNALAAFIAHLEAGTLNKWVLMCTSSSVVHVGFVFPRVCTGRGRCPYEKVAVDSLYPYGPREEYHEPHEPGQVHMVSYFSTLAHRASDKMGDGPCCFLNQNYTSGDETCRMVYNVPLSPLEAALTEQFLFVQLGAGFNKKGLYTNWTGLGLGDVPVTPWAEKHTKRRRRPDEVLTDPGVVRHVVRERPKLLDKWLSIHEVPRLGPQFCSQYVWGAFDYAGVVSHKNHCAASTTPAMIIALVHDCFPREHTFVMSGARVSPPIYSKRLQYR